MSELVRHELKGGMDRRVGRELTRLDGRGRLELARIHQEADRDGVKRAELNSPFAELTNRTIGLDHDDADDQGQDDDSDGPAGTVEAQEGPWRPQRPHRTRRVLVGSTAARGQQTTNPEASRPRGSNVTLMAEGEGFEPSKSLHP